MSEQKLTEIQKTKLHLYALLLAKKVETLTPEELIVSYQLSVDKDIQHILEGQRT